MPAGCGVHQGTMYALPTSDAPLCLSGQEILHPGARGVHRLHAAGEGPGLRCTFWSGATELKRMLGVRQNLVMHQPPCILFGACLCCVGIAGVCQHVSSM